LPCYNIVEDITWQKAKRRQDGYEEWANPLPKYGIELFMKSPLKIILLNTVIVTIISQQEFWREHSKHSAQTYSVCVCVCVCIGECVFIDLQF
jgi:hypothetical protein